MHIILDNISWMGFNIALACIAIFFGWLMKEAAGKLFKFFYGLLWLLFLPNTLYLLTDVTHFFDSQYTVEGIWHVILDFQYLTLIIIGIVTYIAAVYPFEKLLLKSPLKQYTNIFLLLLNGLVGFGVTLGRVERTNSWYVLTHALRVIHDSLQVLTSAELILFSLFFAVLGNVVYFSLEIVLEQRRKLN